ncbi:hypothetical protein T440DRAFT_92090 [Plenodomus tracheiphilus IPT5]|uniref:Uncharacterized protein n=1 Tax=Plenodomus tracheiphilus IPT5 TaxID=1408161 RepID=A0A6A7B749_9PLEO|nr:hypothetical protein T440DRAFT_92090 [Plenodomus tracheiphilus IPT5]
MNMMRAHWGPFVLWLRSGELHSLRTEVCLSPAGGVVSRPLPRPVCPEPGEEGQTGRHGAWGPMESGLLARRAREVPDVDGVGWSSRRAQPCLRLDGQQSRAGGARARALLVRVPLSWSRLQGQLSHLRIFARQNALGHVRQRLAIADEMPVASL